MTWQQLQEHTNAACMAVFGSALEALGTQAVLGLVNVEGDFLEPSDQVYLEGASAISNTPQFIMLSSAVPVSVVGLSLSVAGRNFTVGQAKPDGLGLTILLLEPVL
jgi:hypothetical protein